MVADLLLQLTDQADHIDLALNQLSGVGLVQMHLEEGLGTGQRLIAQAHRQVADDRLGPCQMEERASVRATDLWGADHQASQ